MSGGHGGKRNGAGRPKGRLAQETADIKAMVLGALQDVGGREYLAARAIDAPTAFMGLLGKILPTQLIGDPNNPVSFVIRAPAAIESAEQWLNQYAPKLIVADETDVVADETIEDATNE